MGKFADFYRQLNESKYVRHNQNPFGTTKNGDCVIRSISKGLDIPYEEICKMFGRKSIEGKGLDGDGITLDELNDFSRNKNLIKGMRFDMDFFDYMNGKTSEYKPKKRWPSLREFTDMAKQKYIVLLRRHDVDMSHDSAKDAFRRLFHVVYVDGEKHEYYDNMRYDPGDLKVYGFYKIV